MTAVPEQRSGSDSLLPLKNHFGPVVSFLEPVATSRDKSRCGLFKIKIIQLLNC